MRTIQSPGVELFERDISQNPTIPAGTNVFLAGFAPKGPSDETLQITSVAELEQIYGVPSTPAERYFYFTAREILQDSPANLFVSRLPYGDDRGVGFGNTYGALVYPAGSITGYSTVVNGASSVTVSTSSYDLGGVFLWETVVGSSITGLSGIVPSTTVATTSSSNLTGSTVTTVFAVVSSNTLGTSYTYSNSHSISAGTHVVGRPKFFELTLTEYLSVLDGTAFRWSTSGGDINNIHDFGKAGMIVLNPGQTTTDPRGEGYYVALTDNTNAEPTTNHDSLNAVYTVSQSVASGGTLDYTQIPGDRLYFSLTATNDAGTARDNSNISLNMERSFYAFADATTSKFDDVVALNVYKLRRSPYTPEVTKLEYTTQESYMGSFDYFRKIQDQNGGPELSYYIGSQASNSRNIKLLINDNINSRTSETWLNYSGVPKKKVRFTSHSTINALTQDVSLASTFGGDAATFTTAVNALDYSDALFPLGPYVDLTFTNKNIGSIPLKLDRALYRIENDEIFPLDLVVEGGLGTIYAVCSANGTSFYDDTIITDTLIQGLDSLTTSNEYTYASEAADLRGNYHAVFSRFETFCAQQRKDCLLIADPIRHIFVRGENSLVLSDHNKSFSQYIYNALRHNLELANSSYACTYGNWVKVNDPYAGMNVWVPFSGFAAANMAQTDANFQPWYAPAGFTRGRVRNALAMAITPKQKERDQLYKISINPVAFFPNDGFTIYGQKTLQRQPSAFDRINVRRLFLFLEKATKSTVKYFVFEPNTLFTRTRVINTLQPIFDLAKNSEGLYDYMIVCDRRNNTGDVIDRNELIIDIYLKPVRAAEFILVNFIATRTSANFSELIAGPRL